jgi:hypothetical protein
MPYQHTGPETVPVEMTEHELHEAIMACKHAAIPERQPTLLPLVEKYEEALTRFDHGRTRGFSLWPQQKE